MVLESTLIESCLDRADPLVMRTEVPFTDQPPGLAGWRAESWADPATALELRAALSTRFVRHSFLASLAFTATVIVLVIVLPAYV